jgi:outer membrane immunogenic protein
MKSRRALFGMAVAGAVGTISLCASQANADGYMSGPRYAAPFSWTGLYVGVNGGVDWFDNNWHVPLTPFNISGGCIGCPTSAGSHSASSGLVGGQIGFNYQLDRTWVLGVEVQDDWTHLRASNTSRFLGPSFDDNSKTTSVGTITGRVGVAFDRSLFYVKGGAAWAEDKFWTSFAPTGQLIQSLSDTRWGVVGGVGVEYALHRNWSVKLEYDHMDFGRERERLACIAGCFQGFEYGVQQTIDVVQIGINYKFGLDDRAVPLK